MIGVGLIVWGMLFSIRQFMPLTPPNNRVTGKVAVRVNFDEHDRLVPATKDGNSIGYILVDVDEIEKWRAIGWNINLNDTNKE